MGPFCDLRHQMIKETIKCTHITRNYTVPRSHRSGDSSGLVETETQSLVQSVTHNYIFESLVKLLIGKRIKKNNKIVTTRS